MFDFTNFHDNSRARFTSCDVPDRAPDFTSDSGSAYWDTGDGVVRLSDHWVGQHGVKAIRSCLWQINVETAYSYRAAGYCAYADFSLRKTVPVWHQVTKKDRQIAEELDGVAIAASDWVTGQGRRTTKRPVPVWAQECFTKSSKVRKVRALLKDRPQVQSAILADQKFIRAILKGQGRIKIGERLES